MALQNRDPRAAALTEALSQARTLSRSDEHRRAIAAYRRALEIDPASDSARWELALSLMELREFSAANAELRILLNSRGNDWEPHYKAGICSLNLKEYEQALRDFDAARRLNPRPTEAFVYFVNMAEARIHLDREHFAEAEPLLREAAARRPTPAARAALALAEWARGDHNDADRRSRQALSEDGALIDALLVQADLRSRSDSAEALELGKRLLQALENEQAPSPAAPRYARVMLYIGKKSALRQEWRQAVAAFDRVNIQGLNSSAAALRDYNFYYGVALLRSNELDRAINQLNRVSRSPQADYFLAEAGARQENLERVFTHLSKAGEADATLWTRAEADPVFQQLAANNADFAEFLRRRGQTPAPVPTPTPPSAPPSESRENPR